MHSVKVGQQSILVTNCRKVRGWVVLRDTGENIEEKKEEIEGGHGGATLFIQQNKIGKGGMLGCVNFNDHLEIWSVPSEEIKVKVKVSNLMQDFNTAYLMFLSTRSMFVSIYIYIYIVNYIYIYI